MACPIRVGGSSQPTNRLDFICPQTRVTTTLGFPLAAPWLTPLLTLAIQSERQSIR
jgi:hypothetical protein